MMMNPACLLALPGRRGAQMIAALVIIGMLGVTGLARQNPPKPADPTPAKNETPVEHADDLKSKVTLSVYGLSNDVNVDINLRHQFGPVVAWVAGFYDRKGDSRARIGGEYDFQYKWLALT